MRNQFDFLTHDDTTQCIVVRLKKVDVLWVNPLFKENLVDFAYVIDDDRQPYPHNPENFIPESYAIGFADRYGSLTTVSIGSGRALMVGEYQIKGCGLTHYSMTNLRSHYNSGMMLVAEARNELVYSRMFDALGIGTPIHGVLVHNTPTPWWNSDFWARRDIIHFEEEGALVIRDFHLRPGHFMPSPCNDLEMFGTSEYLRLTRLYSQFDQMVGMPIDEYFTSLPTILASKYARNICYRISVGALTDTNISMTGDIVDYGSSNVWPSWDPTTHTTHTSGHSLWTEHTTIGDMIRDWVTYTNYMRFTNIDVEPLVSIFTSEYSSANLVAWANMVGSDDPLVGKMVETTIATNPINGHRQLLDSINAIMGGDFAQNEFEHWLLNFNLNELATIKVITTMNFLDLHELFHFWPNMGDVWWPIDDKWDVLDRLRADVFSIKTVYKPFSIGGLLSTEIDIVALAIKLNTLSPIQYLSIISATPNLAEK